MNGLQLTVLLVGVTGEKEFIDFVKVRLATHKTMLRSWLREGVKRASVIGRVI